MEKLLMRESVLRSICRNRTLVAARTRHCTQWRTSCMPSYTRALEHHKPVRCVAPHSYVAHGCALVTTAVEVAERDEVESVLCPLRSLHAPFH